MAQRILVADELAPEGLEALKASGMQYDEKVGLTPEQLAAEVGNYDALIVRSKAKVPAKVLANPGKLRIIARAGVGVDTIDLDAATAKGILVINTAAASTLSTAEHALALMFALARKIPAGHAHVSAGPAKWEKAKYQGTQLAGKTLGVVGLGRIGQTVASRALAMEMKVIGFDPFFSGQSALDGKVPLYRDFDQFLGLCDVITFHVPGGEGTKHLLNRERLFGKCRPNLLVVNDARGEVVDEYALAEAIKEKKIAGAALDVYQTEPPAKDHPLFGLDNVVLTPHLGASTDEAQEKAGTAVAKSVKLALSGEFVPDAVNVQGGAIAEDVRPGLPLAEKLGRVFTALAGGIASRIEVEVRGEIAQYDVKVLELAVLKGVFTDVVETSVTYVNAPLFAQDRGVEMSLTTDDESPDYRNLITVRGTMPNGTQLSIAGTLVRPKYTEKLVKVDNFDVDLNLSEHFGFFRYVDRPGVVGVIGQLLGEHGINIAGMQVARTSAGGKALSVLTVDSRVPDGLLEKVRLAIDADLMQEIDITES